MAGAHKKQSAAASSRFVSLVSELGSPLTRSEKLDRDPWLDRLDRLEAKLDARFDEVKKLLQELFGDSGEEEAGVEEEEEEEIATDEVEKEEDDEAAAAIVEEEEIEEEEKEVEGGSTNTQLERQQQMEAILGADLGPFQALISQPLSAANDQRSQAEFLFNLCRERHRDALALKLGHLLRSSPLLEIHGMSAILLRKQLTRDSSSSSETPSSIEQSIHIQCSSGVCKNSLKKGELQFVIKLEMTVEIGVDEFPKPLPRPPPEPPPEPPPRTEDKVEIKVLDQPLCKVPWVRFRRNSWEYICLSICRGKYPGPTVGVIECPNVQAIKSAVCALDDFPCVSIQCNARESTYQALGWQVTAAKIGMQRCTASAQLFNERILLSRYAHVPLGNFEIDWLLFTADVFFARALRDQQQVLWISDDGIPDLGGLSEGERCLVDEVNQPAFTYPGAYRREAVELKIHYLAVNALLKSSQVDEMEGGSLFRYDHEVNSGLYVPEAEIDETSSCAPAFPVLKQLIQRCISDAVASGNVFADAMLQHLYRWLCSPRSKLHDPALRRVLYKVMKKVFALLLAEFRKPGATLIFANFSKFIIYTGKIDLPAAHAYCDSLLKTLQTRDLFEWIELEPLHYWHSLLFMDQFNYGGIQAKLATGLVEIEAGETQVEIISSWNIAEYLPKETQDHFILTVSEFLYIPWKYSREQISLRATTMDGNTCTPSITVTAAETLEIKYLKDQISNYFTLKLFRIVEDALDHFKGKKKMDVDDPAAVRGFPRAPDSNQHKGDAALEFIKHVCAVLALDQNVEHDILKMRKNLLKIVRVKEFAPEAQFLDPCSSYTIPNVICSYCNDCRDLSILSSGY